MTEAQAKLDYADAVADWFLELGEMRSSCGALEEGLNWTQLAASILCRQSRNLSSARIEALLQYAARQLAGTEDIVLSTSDARSLGAKAVCLHVLEEALPAGGLTAMAKRWMQNDQSGRVHSLALLSQQAPVPEGLRQIVQETGGCIYQANPADSILARAAWLRKLAYESADHVVLHIGVTDVICGVAFGIEGGPPIFLVNHAAHIFWTGASIPDLVVNCRGSALETLWTAAYRGAQCITVPIPLPETNSHPPQNTLVSSNKNEAKRAMGIPANSIAILTVGAAFKYSPLGDFDFLKAIADVLKQVPEAYLLVVGFRADSRWDAVSEKLEARIKTFGVVPQAQLAKMHEATDIYVEGFPFGSTTALLEAGLKGIPVVLPPADCPPPFTTDGIALDDWLKRPASIKEFTEEIVQLCHSQSERLIYGERIQAAVMRHHTGDGWRQYLERAIKTLPVQHSVRRAIVPTQTPEAVHEYWFEFVSATDSGYEETLEHAVTRSLLLGMRPRLTRSVVEACKRHKAVRRRHTIPLPTLIFLCNYLLPILPIGWALKLFRAVSFLCRKSLLARLRQRMANLVVGSGGKRLWYEDYRKVSGS